MSNNLASLRFGRASAFGLMFAVLGSLPTIQADDLANDFRTPKKQTEPATRAGIPGEFEQQAALVLSWKSEEVPVIGTLLEIGQLTSKKAPLIVLVSSAEEREHAETALEAARINLRNVQFLEAPVDTIWARDFGPVVVRNADGSAHFVDSDYDDGDRPQDDNIPPVLAAAAGIKCIRSLLTIEGGNLLSNGGGLCLTTSKTVADNVIRGYEHAQVAPMCRKIFQCQDVIVLEPLVGEPTGHVDMFATFTSADTVVVGSIDPQADPVNAAVLDRNARKLSEVITPAGPLRVERIPMPAQAEGLWRSFTNVLYFNGILIMPTYAGVDFEMERAAADVYRRLLPDWDVQGIDCTRLIRMGGAIHCVTLNLPELNPARNRKTPARRPVPITRPTRRETRVVDPFMFGSEHSANPAMRVARPFAADDFETP